MADQQQVQVLHQQDRDQIDALLQFLIEHPHLLQRELQLQMLLESEDANADVRALLHIHQRREVRPVQVKLVQSIR
jgi:hypothetical protein